PWTSADWRSEDWRARLDAFLASDRSRGFDPSVAPLARGALFRIGESRWIFIWTFHHMLVDGQSYFTIITEGFARYDAIRQGRTATLPDPPAFSTFTDWLPGHQRTQASDADRCWRNLLAGVAAPTPLPITRAGDGTAPIAHREHTRRLTTDVTGALQAFARS